MYESLQQILVEKGPFLVNLLGALAILLVGYLVAKFLGRMARKGSARTGLSTKLSAAFADDDGQQPDVGPYISQGVFYLVMVFVLVAFLQTLGLTFVTEPLNGFLTQVFEFLPQLLAAGALAVVAYVVARLLKGLTQRGLEAANLDEKIKQGADTSYEGAGIATTGATAVYYLVLLLFLPAILGALQLQGILSPIEGMLSEAMSFLPNLVAAGLIFGIGYFVARLVRQIVSNLLAAVGTDRLAERVGLHSVLGKQRLSQTLGTIVYVLMLVPVLISALNALSLEAVTAPASRMLDMMLAVIPQLFGAAVVLGIAFVIGKLVAGLVTSLLAGIGFNQLFATLGIRASAASNGQAVEAEDRKLPADIAGSLVLVGVMLFAAIEAANLVGFTSLSAVFTQVMGFAGQVLLGLVIFALGLYLSNIAGNAIKHSNIAQGNMLALVARTAILVFVGAIALGQMGLANSIINLAFGLTLGAIAIAAAIAFGFGGRDVAKAQLEQFFASRDGEAPNATKKGVGKAAFQEVG
ncbi:MAG: mechanosensitive ion channel [Bacteroidota bacterium]